jgi:predicted nucleotidyltransferase
MHGPVKHPTPYSELNDVLQRYAKGVKLVLGENLIGVYVAGSFAVGDADEFSDADAMVITEDEITVEQLAALQVLHGRIYELDSAWAQHLEISYLPRALLNDRESVGVAKLWYLDNGHRSLQLHTHDNTWVVRWVLRECCIPLIGPAAKTLIDPIPEDLMKEALCAVVRNWGGDLVADPQLMVARWYQAFVVVTWCRILKTLETGRIHSKPVSALWSQQNLDERWSPLIQKALAERRLPWEVKVLESAQPEDLQETLEFTRHVLARIEA